MKIVFLLLLATTLQAHQAMMTKIETLNSTEPYAPMAFHQGKLWLGRADYSSRRPQHRIEARSADGERIIASAPVSHSVERLYAFDPNRILILGKAYTSKGWVTYYTAARFTGKRIVLEVNPVSTQYQVEEFAGTPERLFFNETGDRGIVEVTASTHHLLPWTISGPGKLQLVGNVLWVLERNSFRFGDENIVRIDLATQRAERVFNSLRSGLSQILALNNGSAIATGEYYGEKVILIDSHNQNQQKTVAIPGTHPRSLAQWENCLIVASEDPHRLTVISLKTPTPTVVLEFPLETYASDLPILRNLTVDPDSASLFIRSSHVPELGTHSQNSVYRFNNSQVITACE